jgi:hypothetical protein
VSPTGHLFTATHLHGLRTLVQVLPCHALVANFNAPGCRRQHTATDELHLPSNQTRPSALFPEESPNERRPRFLMMDSSSGRVVTDLVRKLRDLVPRIEADAGDGM